MDREIKFRAWHKEDKQMIDWFTLTQSAWNTHRGDYRLSLLYDVLVAKKDHFEVMQFTGLQDKNGKDIYDGDVLGSSKSLNLIVVFEDGGFCFKNLTDSGADRLSQNRVSRLEIIGNIYENPELIENEADNG